MSSIKIYHNPMCSKSRQVLSLIEKEGIEPEIILYLEKGLSVKEVKHILNILKVDIRYIMREKDSCFQEKELSNPLLKEEVLIEALVSNPKLLERPIVIFDNSKGMVCRPPELVFNVLR